MARTRPRDYCGAVGRISLEDIAGLKPHWRVQPKVDGMYAVAETDGRGVVVRVRSRTGRAIDSDLIGVTSGCVDSHLAGELSAHTTPGVAEAQRLGYQRLHVFDLVRWEGCSLARLPYRDRRGLLLRLTAEQQARTMDAPEVIDGRGRARTAHGRYARHVPQSWRRLPVVPEYPVDLAARAWVLHVERGAAEGLVAVNGRAKLGAHRAKRKCKLTSELDCRVVAIRGQRATLVVEDGSRRHDGKEVWVGVGHWLKTPGALVVGDLVELTHDGWHRASGQPRFARVTRVRSDLVH